MKDLYGTISVDNGVSKAASSDMQSAKTEKLDILVEVQTDDEIKKSQLNRIVAIHNALQEV